MKKVIMTAILVLSSFANADMEVECNIGKERFVTLTDAGSKGYALVDSHQDFLQSTEEINPLIDTYDSLIFALDNGTSIKDVYQFSGLRKCYSEGEARTRLEIFQHGPVGYQGPTKEVRCKCWAD
ncbi:MAG: hypothetical protein V4736_00630 [Bdellovibrionota bacterium]